ncbi:MAG: hypothetical protein DMF62_06605 [Acidobacteria bacterium]|nr:MAG: hypothetical protein DMF62_06605 [Acidobacteriota bacterium]
MRSTATFILCLFAVTILLPSRAFCDVAPEPGYKRITIDLILETNGDVSDYRLFIKSGGDLKEVFISPGKQTHILPLGGGAFYSTGTLVAVPKKNLEDLDDAPDEGKLSEKAVYGGKVPGAIELVNHRFSREVREGEAAGYQDPVYRIERDPQSGLKAVYVSGGAAVGQTIATESSGRLFWQSAGAAIVAGIFLVFGITILGIIHFRKKAKEL